MKETKSGQSAAVRLEIAIWMVIIFHGGMHYPLFPYSKYNQCVNNTICIYQGQSYTQYPLFAKTFELD